MRDNLIHRYFGVDYDIVWSVLKNRIPELAEKIPKIIADVNRNQYLNYSSQVLAKKTSLSESKSYFQERLNDEQKDIAIAKIILNEYETLKSNVAISKVKDILSQSDRVCKINLGTENTDLKAYINQVISAANQSKIEPWQQEEKL